jgi:two-component system, OmpR family, response regulator
MRGLCSHDGDVPRVGVIEDDATIRRVLADALRMSGYEVVTATNCAEGLLLCGPSSGTQVVIIDIGLPDGDGRDVCRGLRALGQDAPVLFLTALGSAMDRESGFAAGGNDYMTKPFSLAELSRHVGDLIRTDTAPQMPG